MCFIYCIKLQVVEEFVSLHHSDVRLRDVWPRTAIMEKAVLMSASNADLQKLMEQLTDPWDEGELYCSYSVSYFAILLTLFIWLFDIWSIYQAFVSDCQ